MQVLHTIPKTSTIGDYFYRLGQAIMNRDEVIIFDKPTVRKLYMQAYPKAKV